MNISVQLQIFKVNKLVFYDLQRTSDENSSIWSINWLLADMLSISNIFSLNIQIQKSLLSALLPRSYGIYHCQIKSEMIISITRYYNLNKNMASLLLLCRVQTLQHKCHPFCPRHLSSLFNFNMFWSSWPFPSSSH